jgi:hypothetical protein
MPDLTAKRTLVKSPPELWDELSEVEGLAKHLGAFGEIKITKLEPEHTVAWEGEHASGTVSIEPSGWGTRVTLHAELPDEAAPEAEEPVADEPPVAEEPPVAQEPPGEEPPAEEPSVGQEPSTEEPPSAEEPPVAEEPVAEEPVAEEPVADVEPVAEESQAPVRRRGFWGWLFRTRTAGPEVEQNPVAEPEPVAIGPEPVVHQPEPEPAVGPEPVVAEPEPVVAEPEPVVAEPEPEPTVAEAEPTVAEPEPVVAEPEPVVAEAEVDEEAEPAVDPERARAILDEALDALGAAHHRPFSRG